MSETWKDIKGYEGFYQVSSFGRVKRLGLYTIYGEKVKKDKLLRLSKYRYISCGLSKNNIVKTMRVHRLVAEAFISEKNGDVVNHIDGDTFNNNVENLEWVTQLSNIKHSWETGLQNKNTITRKDNNSGFTGIHFDKSRNRYISSLYWEGKNLLYKRFNDINDAIMARNNAIIENNLVNQFNLQSHE